MDLIFEAVKSKIENRFPINLTDDEVLILQSEFIKAYEKEGKPYGDTDGGLFRFIKEGTFGVGEEVKGGQENT